MDTLVIFFLGLVVGSFLNVVILRTKKGTSPLKGRSACERCAVKLGPTDLIPLVSFCMLRGRCRTCSVGLSAQYPLVEFATGMLFLLAYWNVFPQGLFDASISMSSVFSLVRLWTFISVLMILFVYDFRWFLVPTSIVIPAAVLAYLGNSIFYSSSIACLNDFSFTCLLQISWIHYLLGALVGGLFFTVQYMVSGGRWVGEGDIYLGALIGAMLGFPLILLSLFIAYMVGSLVSVVLLLFFRYTMKSALPFGPFLTGAAIVVLVYQEPLLIFVRTLFYLP